MASKATPRSRSAVTEPPKRPAAAAAASVDSRAAKRFKVLGRAPAEESEASLLDSVVGALDAVETTSTTPHGREMLRVMAPDCLSTPADKRHAFQRSVAAMLQEVLADVRSDMEHCLKGAVDRVEEALAARSSCEKGVEASLEVVASSEASVNRAMRCFYEDNVALEQARTRLNEAKEAHAPLIVKAAEAKELSACLEDVLEKHYTQFLEVTDSDHEAHFAAILKLVLRLPIEESLRRSVAGLGAVNPQTRGAFDKMALTQLGKELGNFKEILVKKEAEAEEQLTKHSEEVAAAEEKMQTARQVQRRSALALRLAEGGGWNVSGSLGAAEDRSREAQANYITAKSREMAGELDLDAFQRGPLAAVQELCQRGTVASA